MNNNDRIVFVMFFAVVFVCVMSGIGFYIYKTNVQKQAYYECLENNKQIAEKSKNVSYLSLNMCYMF